MLSITSDYVRSDDDPKPYLERIAQAGFTHVHWCHQWNSDFLYPTEEITQIDGYLKRFGLRLLNLHASQGKERYWVAYDEAQRLAGIELVKNRIEMTARLGGKVMIIHIPITEEREVRPSRMEQIRKSLDDVEDFARLHGVRLALENMDADDFEMLETLLVEYDPAYLGLCYDSGHANLGGPGIDKLDQLKDRLIAVHLHDNDGTNDQHQIPFTGSVDWPKLTQVIAASAYQECVNLEVGIHHSDYQDEMAFLRQAYQAGEKLVAMIDTQRPHPRGLTR